MRGSKIIITLLIIVLIMLFAGAVMAAPPDKQIVEKSESTTTLVFELLNKLVATGGVVGLWLRYEINKKTNKKKETVNHSELILKIDESNKKIEGVSDRLVSLEESKESEKASQNIKFEIQQVCFEGLKGVEAQSFHEVAIYAVNKLSAIFANILLVDFKTPLESLKIQIDIVMNQAMNFEINNGVLSNEQANELREDLSCKLDKLNARLILDLQTVFRKSNGVRRAAFSELVKDYIKNALFEATELFKEKLK